MTTILYLLVLIGVAVFFLSPVVGVVFLIAKRPRWAVRAFLVFPASVVVLIFAGVAQFAMLESAHSAAFRSASASAPVNSAGAFSTTSTTVAAATVAASRCGLSDLAVVDAGGITYLDGTSNVDLRIENNSSHACYVDGYLRVNALVARAVVASVPASTQVVAPVLLQGNGDSEDVTFNITDNSVATDGSCPGITSYVVSFPSVNGSLSAVAVSPVDVCGRATMTESVYGAS